MLTILDVRQPGHSKRISKDIEKNTIWRFLKWGSPPVIIHFNEKFYYQNQPAIGHPPMIMEPPLDDICWTPLDEPETKNHG